MVGLPRGNWRDDSGHGERCFIIAEAGVNHNGDLALAKRLVSEAANVGADAVKIQTFQAQRVVTAKASKAAYQEETTGGSETQREMLERLELSREAHEEIQACCREHGVLFVSTPFDKESVELLDDLSVLFFKIGSGEVTNTPFLEFVSCKGRPIVLSTGMSTLAEVDTAVRAMERAGCKDLTLLHCVSAYPADPADANLRAMQTMAAAWGYPVGYSDHTPGIELPLVAVALGACVIEKHFTLDQTLPGPDHRASVEPDEFARMVQGIRAVERALGTGRKEPVAAEKDTAIAARRSLVAASDIEIGETLQLEDIAILRPGTGLPPSMLPHVLGHLVKVRIPSGTILGLEMLA